MYINKYVPNDTSKRCVVVGIVSDSLSVSLDFIQNQRLPGFFVEQGT